MQTRTYGDLFKLIQSLAGVGSFASSEEDDIANFINRRFFQAYQTSQAWPRYVVTGEERQLISLVITGTDGTAGLGADATLINQNYRLLGTVTSGDANAEPGTNIYSGTTNTVLIYKNTSNRWAIDIGATATEQSDGTYDVAPSSPPEFVANDSTKKDSVSAVENWARSSPGTGTTGPTVTDVQLVPYVQSGKNTIGEFIRIHRKKPFLNNSQIEYDFYVDAEGANILNITNSTDNVAFATYKKPFTALTTSSSYDTSTETVPAEFFHYIGHAAYADFLRMDGQTDKALIEENTAGEYLALELERVDLITNNNTINKRFSTYVNRQSR